MIAKELIMKNYKTFEKHCIGSSDGAALTLRIGGELFDLRFGQDDAYSAYVCMVDDPAEVEIGTHYTKVASGTHWISIFDDYFLCFKARARQIEVWRAGQMGCIIVLAGDPHLEPLPQISC